ncbi:unnamed protein product [Choristocarpus tenellus]
MHIDRIKCGIFNASPGYTNYCRRKNVNIKQCKTMATPVAQVGSVIDRSERNDYARKSCDEQELDDFLAGLDGSSSSAATKPSSMFFYPDLSSVGWDHGGNGVSREGDKDLVEVDVESWLDGLGSRGNYGIGSTPIEVPGVEPEIIEDDFEREMEKLELGKETDASPLNALAGLKVASKVTGTGTEVQVIKSRYENATESAGVRNDHEKGGGKESASTTDLGAAEEHLDWPETLDSLGLGEADTSLVLPMQQTEEFPDFVEVRDPSHISQWPKFTSPVKIRQGGIRGGGGGGGVGATRVQLPAPLRTVEVFLRPDVTWESVSDVYLAVVLSRGLVVREQTEKQVIADTVANSSPGEWRTVTLRVGVTRDKLRTLVMQFFQDSGVGAQREAPILSLAGTMVRLNGRAGDDLYHAIRDALVGHKMPLSFLASNAHQVSLDPHYIRDLVAMYSHENTVNLTKYALPLEEFVRKEEERSAKLEATLLPKYNEGGLEVPRPTRALPLSSYPLTTSRPPVSSCGVKEAREIMERAQYRAFGGGREVEALSTAAAAAQGGAGAAPAEWNGGEGSGREGRGELAGRGRAGEGKSADIARKIRALIRATWEDVTAWCDEEAQARVRRKDTQVRERLLAVERHREALVAVLRDSGVTSSSPPNCDFGARFRLMAEEVVLFNCQAAHANRVGRLYLTYK